MKIMFCANFTSYFFFDFMKTQANCFQLFQLPFLSPRCHALWKWWRISLKIAKFYFGTSVWFCLQWNFASYLTLRTMFIGRFGYFLNQIKLNKFYQFLVLSGRFVLPPSARQKKKKKYQKLQQIYFLLKSVLNVSQLKILLSSKAVFSFMQWELSNLPASTAPRKVNDFYQDKTFYNVDLGTMSQSIRP